MSLLNALKALLAKLKALLEALLDQLDPDSVAIQGAAIQNQILTADESDIDHDNGQPFTYQWLADGQAIAGATAKNYTLTQADVGKHITLSVTYRNESNQLVTLSSEQTGAVLNVNDAVTGNVVIQAPAGEPFRQGILLTANTAAIADIDGLGAFQYQWKANGININGANGATYQLTQADVGKNISVKVSYIDGFGTAESVTSNNTPIIANVNDAPTGNVVIQGNAEVNQTLTANTSAIADLDGLGAFSYQWQANGVNINGANAATYLLTTAEAGKAITVNVSYTDGFGAHEQLISNATAAVAGGIVSTVVPVSVLLENNNITISDELGNNTVYNGNNITQLQLAAQYDDFVVVKNSINGLHIDMGEHANDHDTIDLRGITGATFNTNTSTLQDSNGNITTITNAENILLGQPGNHIVVNSSGNYNFLLDQAYVSGNANYNDIRLIEGTGQGTIGIGYFNSAGGATAGNQNLLINMEFNNAGPNTDNVATLDFANGHYSFNYTLLELLAVLVAIGVISNIEGTLGAFGELALVLSDTDADPVDSVTAKVTGLKNFVDTTQDPDFRPWTFVENQTGERGTIDLSQLVGNGPNPALPAMYVLWNNNSAFIAEDNPLIPKQEGFPLFISPDLNSNTHIFRNFQELKLGQGDDKILTTPIDGNVIDMGEKVGGGDRDTLDTASGTNGVSFNMVTGLYTEILTNDTMYVYNVENFEGGSGDDVIVGSDEDNIITGGPSNDIITGGGGSDTFVYGTIGDTYFHTITDFSAVQDKFLLAGGLSVHDHFFSGSDTVLTFGTAGSSAEYVVRLLGVHITESDIQYQFTA